jgi:hypothetical protein
VGRKSSSVKGCSRSRAAADDRSHHQHATDGTVSRHARLGGTLIFN